MEFNEVSGRERVLIGPLLPSRARVGRPRKDDRVVLNGILYVLVTGCRWMDMPVHFTCIHGREFYSSGIECSDEFYFNLGYVFEIRVGGQEQLAVLFGDREVYAVVEGEERLLRPLKILLLQFGSSVRG